MNPTELRDAFLESAAGLVAARKVVTDLIVRFQHEPTQYSKPHEPALLLHLVPLSAVTLRRRLLTTKQLQEAIKLIKVTRMDDCQTRFNGDGVIRWHSNAPTQWSEFNGYYTQLFRDGVLECFSQHGFGELTRINSEPIACILGLTAEELIALPLKRFAQFAEAAGLASPFVATLTLLNAGGYRIAHRPQADIGQKIGSVLVRSPEAFIDGLDDNALNAASKELRDFLWQCSGQSASLHTNEDGSWSGRFE